MHFLIQWVIIYCKFCRVMASFQQLSVRPDQILAMLENLPSDDDSSEESDADHDDDDSIPNSNGITHTCTLCMTVNFYIQTVNRRIYS